MSTHNTNMKAFIAEEVSKVRGIAVPVRAGLIERAVVRQAKCSKLHPNPDDEFCFPDIGPSEAIVSNYMKEYALLKQDPHGTLFRDTNIKESLMVQKIHPDGYMILNGHHRWIAAVRTNYPKLKIRIVNLTQEKDVRRMLEHSKHDRRITLDMEEVVFASGKDTETEKPLGFPFRKFFPERLRLGIPALFSYCVSAGYDIWLYSSGYESMDYVREIMKLYHAPVTGIITGTARKAPKNSAQREKLESLVAAKYSRTLHADLHTLLCIDGGTKEFREFPLSGEIPWAAEIIDIIGALDKDA